MFAVIFEVQPKQARREDYLHLAKELRPELEKVEGFLDNTRFVSRRRNNRLLARGSARLQEALVKQILELHAPRLVTSRVGVGQVIRDVVHIHLLRRHTAGGAE